MTLIVEDGTGVTSAESYITVADADTYFSNRGNTTWAALTTTAKEQALRKGCDYLVQTYRLRWKGVRVASTQSLDWPRASVERTDYSYSGLNGYTTVGGVYYFPSDEVPTEVSRANAELAYRSLSADLLADVGAQVKSETVGPISVTYQDGARQSTSYKAIDAMLAPYLQAAGMISVVRG